jgi:hypothetical protein
MSGSDQVVKRRRPGADTPSLFCFLSTSRIPNGAKLICTHFEFTKWYGMRVVDGFCTVGRA